MARTRPSVRAAMPPLGAANAVTGVGVTPSIGRSRRPANTPAPVTREEDTSDLSDGEEQSGTF